MGVELDSKCGVSLGPVLVSLLMLANSQRLDCVNTCSGVMITEHSASLYRLHILCYVHISVVVIICVNAISQLIM